MWLSGFKDFDDVLNGLIISIVGGPIIGAAFWLFYKIFGKVR